MFFPLFLGNSFRRLHFEFVYIKSIIIVRLAAVFSKFQRERQDRTLKKYNPTFYTKISTIKIMFVADSKNTFGRNFVIN